MASAQFQLLNRTGHGFGNKRIETFQQIQHPADADKTRKLGRHGSLFQSFNRAFGNTSLFRQLGLGEITFQPDAGQPAPQLREHRIIRGLFCYFHNTPNMANKVKFVNRIVIYGEQKSILQIAI